MIYGVKYQNYLKGWYGVYLFGTQKQAESSYKALKELEDAEFESEADYTESFQMVLEKAIAEEEEFRSSSLQEINKDFPYYVNNYGRVTIKTSNMRIINMNNTVTIPC